MIVNDGFGMKILIPEYAARSKSVAPMTQQQNSVQVVESNNNTQRDEEQGVDNPQQLNESKDKVKNEESKEEQQTVIQSDSEDLEIPMPFTKSFPHSPITKIEVNVDNLNSKEELIEKINSLEIEPNQYVEIILVGGRNFEIDKYDLLKYILDERIIKIKDETKIAVELEKIANENTLRGLFVKEMLEKLESTEEDKKEIVEKAIEIGLDALK